MKLNNNDDSHNSGLNLLIYNMLLDIESHPAWVCGLKHCNPWQASLGNPVTPCVGVWIETFILSALFSRIEVTPCVGVWIETCIVLSIFRYSSVTPCVGVWIETILLPKVQIAGRHTLRGCVD